ncbi:Oxoglutarate/iron-dependent dioxygenase [Macleaya cordata]|uniref:Oxoglutarate/iron-dependent dioxygenase n=1 Tax=Macleaya cordata TaxID=56857 RepID=A0A200Q5E6_MACCD|nr:Oxoglutarate/iron-dependent dioxygenase [Macleaya cordata]
MEVSVSAGNSVGVQTLAESGLAHVPSQYIQPPENRPVSFSCRKTSDSGIPVIDLFNFDPQRSDEMCQELRRGCSDWGAFQVRNHGVPKRLLEDMIKVGLTFFKECSVAEKCKYSCDPNSAASEGGVVEEYSDHIKELALKLMSMISESLGLQSSCIEDIVGEVYQNITISYYPPCPQPELTLGLQAHSDIGAITLLIQDDVGGLQVLKDDEWVTVQPLSDAIVVILADQTEIMTNGQYRSAQHRAITNSHRSRLSVGTFHDPSKTRKIAPAAPLISEDSPAKYKEVTYGDYVSSWYTKGPEGKRNIDALLLHQ